MLPKTPAILFDLDGTLVDSFTDIAASANHALAAMGLPTQPLDVIRLCVGRGLVVLVERLLPGSTDDILREMIHHFRDHYREHSLDTTRPYPGIVRMLDAIEGAGLERAVVSNKPEGFVLPILEGLGLRERFAAVVGGDSAGKKKPDPAALALASARGDEAGRPFEPAAFVDDGPEDRAAAQNLVVPFFAVSWGHTPADGWEDLGPHEHLVLSPAELEYALLALARGE